DALELVAIGLRLCGLLEVDEARHPGRDLHAFVAEPGGPFADVVERIERGLVPRELGQENGRSLHGAHAMPSSAARQLHAAHWARASTGNVALILMSRRAATPPATDVGV